MNIKELRKKYGLSQQDLADKTGIPKGRINAWEQRKGPSKASDMEILKRFFDLFYYPGQILQLKYGNGPGRTFIFVKFNSAMMYSDAVPQNYSNTQIEILKIEDLKGKFYMKAQSKRTKSIRFSIDFQGAIDMGEIN